MVTLTEGKYPNEFVASVGNGDISREAGTLAMGEKVVDGQLLRMTGGKLYAVDPGDITTEGLTDFEGIAVGDHDASATGTNADIPGIPYIARLAEVIEANLTYPEESTEGGEKAACDAAMAARFIFPR